MAITCTIDANGITVPAYADILTYLQDSYRGIYGADVYLEADSQDGQLLAIFASALNDANAMAAAVYNAFSPATAQGVGLSSVVKINGLKRNVSSYSTVDLTIIGVAGTTITNGVAADTIGNQWNLPATVTIPTAGSIVVTATAVTEGAITAATGTVTTIQTPTRGWQSVTNVAAAAIGLPVEDDGPLRIRQSLSTALPSTTVLEGIIGGVASIVGVSRYRVYENDTATTDSNGIPKNSIAFVVEGGNALTIAQTIADKKTPGSGTYGTTTETITDAYGIAHAINFSRPVDVPITVAISLHAFSGYTSAIEAAIQQAVADYINALSIGQGVLLSRLYVPANLMNGVDGSTFEITVLEIARDAGIPAASDVTIAFNEAATCLTTGVTITVV